MVAEGFGGWLGETIMRQGEDDAFGDLGFVFDRLVEEKKEMKANGNGRGDKAASAHDPMAAAMGGGGGSIFDDFAPPPPKPKPAASIVDPMAAAMGGGGSIFDDFAAPPPKAKVSASECFESTYFAAISYSL